MNWKSKGFTMIEMLTVIAIIIILTAIIFPVYSRVRDSAYRGSDTSHMNQIGQALALYHADQGAYPPALLGYATMYWNGTAVAGVVPAGKLYGYLYPRREASMGVFQPAYDRESDSTYTTAVWPTPDPTCPTSGMGAAANDCQAFGVGTTVTRPYTLDDDSSAKARGLYENLNGDTLTASSTIGAQFYKMDGFDVATERVSDTTTRVELRYAPFWTGYGLTSGSALDDPRQLGYSNPPDSTVVTWDTYFREYDSSWKPTNVKRDIVLFLGGGARPVSSLDMSQRQWRFTP